MVEDDIVDEISAACSDFRTKLSVSWKFSVIITDDNGLSFNFWRAISRSRSGTAKISLLSESLLCSITILSERLWYWVEINIFGERGEKSQLFKGLVTGDALSLMISTDPSWLTPLLWNSDALIFLDSLLFSERTSASAASMTRPPIQSRYENYHSLR